MPPNIGVRGPWFPVRAFTTRRVAVWRCGGVAVCVAVVTQVTGGFGGTEYGGIVTVPVSRQGNLIPRRSRTVVLLVTSTFVPTAR